jgi:hypothetical protein
MPHFCFAYCTVGRYRNVVNIFCWRHLATSSIFCRNCVELKGRCSIYLKWSEHLDNASSKTMQNILSSGHEHIFIFSLSFNKWLQYWRNNEQVHSHSVLLSFLGGWSMVSIYMYGIYLPTSRLYEYGIYRSIWIYLAIDLSMYIWSIYVYRFNCACSMYIYIHTCVLIISLLYVCTILYLDYIIWCLYNCIHTYIMYIQYICTHAERERESIWAYIEHTMGTEWAHRHHV